MKPVFVVLNRKGEYLNPRSGRFDTVFDPFLHLFRDAESAYFRRDSYTGCGNGTLTVTNGGTVTPITLALDQAKDRRERVFYDNDGRVTGRLDAENYYTENKYDAAGRLVRALILAMKTSTRRSRPSGLAFFRASGSRLSG